MRLSSSRRCYSRRTLPAADIPPTGKPVVILDGKSLENFETFVFGKGFNNDPDEIFRVSDGMVRVEGIPYGYFITKEEYGDFYLLRRIQVGRSDARTPQGP